MSEIEAFFLNEIETCEQKAKKITRSINISIADTSLITSTVLTGGISTVALASGVGLPVGIALGGVSLLFSLITPATRKYLKAFKAAREKHDSIKLLE